MPQTQKLIKTQNNTRKKNIKGGATNTWDAKKGPLSGFRKLVARGATEIKRRSEFNPAEIYIHEIITDATQFNKETIKKIFGVSKGSPIDNYTNYKAYICNPHKVYITKKTQNSTINPCTQNVFSITGFIINENEKKLILTIKEEGYSAVFHSDHFDFNVQDEIIETASKRSKKKKKSE